MDLNFKHKNCSKTKPLKIKPLPLAINTELIYTYEAQEGGKNRNLGVSVPRQVPTLLPIPCSLPKTKRAGKEAGETQQGSA